MRNLIVLVLVFLSVGARAAYFETLFQDPGHPKVSGQTLFTSQGKFDGGTLDAAIVYHRPNQDDSLIYKVCPGCKDAGVLPIGWTLWELGGGFNGDTGFVHTGASVDVAPTLLGSASAALQRAGGKYAVFGKALVSPNGSGVKLSLGWKGNFVEHGQLLRFDELRFPPRYGIGYQYQF